MQRTHTSAHTCSTCKPCMNKLLSKLSKVKPLGHFCLPQTDEIQHLEKPHLMAMESLNQPAATYGLHFTFNKSPLKPFNQAILPQHTLEAAEAVVTSEIINHTNSIAQGRVKTKEISSRYHFFHFHNRLL